MQGRVYAVATMDSKGREIAFVADQIRAAGVDAVTVDVGVKDPPAVPPDVPREDVAAFATAADNLDWASQERGEAVSAMSEALEAFLLREHAAGRVAGVIGLGGSGGTALITRGMRALPIGVPKLMVSTVASGNTAPYVGTSDLTMMFSVLDVAGLNVVSRRIFANAAHAIAGMAGRSHEDESPTDRRVVGMTMFGVTTPCVEAVRGILEGRGVECLVFHATGAGGRAMEKLVASRLIQGVLDVTTTEVADEVVGGVFPAGPDRFDAILQAGVPYVLSLGALDMVNFGAKETVPAEFAGRTLHVHNAQVTLMRTTPEENRRFARWIAGKLNRSTAPVTVVVPEKGVLALDVEGGPFYDPAADAALFDELEKSVEQSASRRIVRAAMHINDPAFAELLVREFDALVG